MNWKEFFQLDKYNLMLTVVVLSLFSYLNFSFSRYFHQNIRGIIYESVYYAGFPIVFYDVGFDVPGNYFHPIAFIVDVAIFVFVLFLVLSIRHIIRIKST